MLITAYSFYVLLYAFMMSKTFLHLIVLSHLLFNFNLTTKAVRIDFLLRCCNSHSANLILSFFMLRSLYWCGAEKANCAFIFM